MLIHTQQRSKNWLWREITYDLSRSRDVAKYIARERYAWPGGYPLFAVTDDGAALCPDCCKTEYRQIAESIPGDGWHTIRIDINYEDDDLFCDHCSNQIKYAYC